MANGLASDDRGYDITAARRDLAYQPGTALATGLADLRADDRRISR